MEDITFKESISTRMTTMKSYDYLNRLTNSVSSAGGSNVVSFRYVYNNANQRTSVTNVDGSYWVYQYDDLGQVTSGRKYWSDASPVAGQQFTYGFDDIGNRETAASGGNNSGTDLQSSSYTANLLNQYSSRTVPAVVGVSGTATNTATVTVNFEPTERKGDYWWGEAPAQNAWGPLWLGITNIAVLDDSPNADIIATNFGHVYVPKSPETFTYDDDGNLTGDGRWSYAWDGENRATSFTRVSSAPDDAKVKLDCQYDSQWRRIEKVVSTWTGSAYAPESTNRFVYDGWNLMAIVDETSTVVQSFTWGTDASGSLQGAGGVGGLISMTVHSGANAGTYFYCYDGNHNVRALVDASDGAVVAEYDYSPFGQLIRATGSLALENPFLFSTKFCDWETGLYYYGYRYYDADTGRWLSRDPIEELSFRGHYAESLRFEDKVRLLQQLPAGSDYIPVENDLIGRTDFLGLTKWQGECEIYGVSLTLGVLFIDCSLTSFCTIGPDDHRESVYVKAALFQAEVGLPVSYATFHAEFTSPGDSDHTTFNGWAVLNSSRQPMQ